MSVLLQSYNPYPELDQQALDAAIKVVRAEPSAALEGDLENAIAAYVFNARGRTYTEAKVQLMLSERQKRDACICAEELEKLELVVGELRACLQAINDEFVDPLEPWGADLELPRDWLLRVRETLKKTSDIKEVMSISDYEAVLADHNRLVRELDVALNGEDGAAKQASLCDIVLQVRRSKDL
jgi:hypothetical protein